ncbi:T9SS type A sorting domain-containing protein [Chitinophagaceae bacterium MMS25-I14]
MKKFIALLGYLALSSSSYAQNGWLPSVYLPGYVCDPTPWKLVFSDDFNGTTLSPKWTTYITWDGMIVKRGTSTISKPYHQDWPGSRIDDGPSILKDQNVVVSNGTCKLLLASDPNSSFSSHDSTTVGNPPFTVSADYSSAIISLPYHNMNGSPNFFNSGRFEARIKFPTFDGAWCAFWLWQGSSVNELDMAESWGGNGNFFNFYQNRRHTNYAVHAWAPSQNPYNLPGECNITEHYPNQSAWQYMTGGYFHQENWHTYAYEWDTASVSAYLDGALIETMWKYSRNAFKYYVNNINGNFSFTAYPFTIGSGCQPIPGTYDITYGYPYNSQSESALRLETKWASHPNYNLGYRYVLGQMEIDYVKVWQKHPELDGHTAICADNTYPPTPTITGPDMLCGQGTYTLSSPIAGGTWSYGNNFNVVSSSSSSITLQHNSLNPYSQSYVGYTYWNGNNGCPTRTVYKSPINCPLLPYTPTSVVWSSNNYGNAKIHLIAPIYPKRDVVNNTTPIVRWDVALTLGEDTYDPRKAQNFTLYGEYASTPSFSFADGSPYDLKWTMKVYNGPDTIIRAGERNSRTKPLQQTSDTNTYYFNAFIDDQDNYDSTIVHEIPKHMISEQEYGDTLFVNEMIERTKADALAPYIITTGMQTIARKTLGTNDISIATKVYPNPIQAGMTIIPGSQFANEGSLQVNVYDLLGKVVSTGLLNYQQGSTIQYDLNGVSNGNYILELSQGSVKERIKILKSNN